jgi:hypothetical protein
MPKTTYLIVLTLVFCTFSLKAQSDFDIFQYREVPSLSFSNNAFSLESAGIQFNLPEVNIFRDRFSSKPQINMVEAAHRKAYRAEQQQEQKFSFIERQSAIFSRFSPKFDNSSDSPFAPSYHEQPIYPGLNRIKNSAYQDLGDQFGRLSPFYQLSPYRRGRNGFYLVR